jgi:hypothetical protein
MSEDRGIGGAGIEIMVERIAELRAVGGEERDALALWPERLYLARNSDGCVELFIEGARDSFGQGALGQSLEHGRYSDIRTGREFEAVVIRAASGEWWARPMAHVAYEAVQAMSRKPDIANDELLQIIAPYLKLVLERRLLSTEQQVGLTGEMIFLQELLTAASALGVAIQAVLDRWTGWDSASRDFKGGAVAVEVKTTGTELRQHWVHPMYQLLAATAEDERVFVFSVGLRVDRSRSYRLTTAVERIMERLPADASTVFLDLLARYAGVGLTMSQWRQYELEPGFLVTQAPALIRVDHLPDILRPEAFRADELPSRVTDLRYRVSLEGLPLATRLEREAVLRELLGA